MYKILKNDLLIVFIILFVLSASFLGTGQIQNENHVLKNYVLPNLIGYTNTFIYLVLVLIFIIIGLLSFINNYKIYKPMLPLLFSYFILFFWSIITVSDQLRYLLLFLSIFLCPIGMLAILEKLNFRSLAKSIFFIASILIFLSTIYSYLNLPELSRVSGIHNNPNLMGMWLVSILTVVLYFSDWVNKKALYIVVTLVTILVIFSGSRLAFIILLILLSPIIFKHSFFSTFAFILGFFYLIMSGDEISIRAVEVGSAVSDSGRENIWAQAIECIYLDPIVGHGMFGAESCVNKPNIHNSYLRLALMLGIPLTIVFFLSFFTFLVKSIFLQVNSYIKLYLIGIPLMFFAEDYISGFASPFFPFLVFILALFLFDLKKSRILEK
ncbi:hypothetical protein [Acinetobacter sp. YH12113]|uniref:hypothetical protein n=1 Tax=Acinetobacter sp. YH12113 TaxID=2601100 RepID=UPI0015D0EEEE|nr:hypothetical protein [Acinetobacter sp. YH12113]